ncbi:hypothetical protein [Dawidia soli]|uniref:Uncharacterized protein n=1 Tax=Dawidia soli TaxID=2782352 RepID=A0AAP2GHJ4_9BACT|nr:hypothetical protein [Dawidia soli]MBT1687276.1 hypothetical protein [Dawidia soli]
MKFIFPLLIAFLLGLTVSSFAQIDTIDTRTQKLNLAALKEGKCTYAVYMEDSLGRRLGSAALWDRSLDIRPGADGRQRHYIFNWDWYQQDTLLMHATATGLLPSLTPLTHYASYRKRGKVSFRFQDNVVTIPDSARRTPRASTFRVKLDPPAFEFPMDLEIFPLLPFKRVGQKFAIAFYEPGTPKSDYYLLTVTGKEDLPLAHAGKVNCWLLRIDYGRGAYATFWITDKSREVMKMKEYYRGRYRYKVRLY